MEIYELMRISSIKEDFTYTGFTTTNFYDLQIVREY